MIKTCGFSYELENEEEQLESEDLKEGIEDKLFIKKIYNPDDENQEREMDIKLNKQLMIKKINYTEKENQNNYQKIANVKPFDFLKKV